MTVLDFARSFVTFVTTGRENNARLQIESVCTLEDGITGTTSDYTFFASCKSEDTFAPRDLFYEDNYDFCGIFSESSYVIFRTRATHTDGFREEGLWRDRFQEVRFHLVEREGEMLTTPEEIVQGSLSNRPLVGRVAVEKGSLKAVMTFPIKTMNANDIRHVYQVDTGPIAFPDFDLPVSENIERLWPAYVAYNASHFADFIIQDPQRVTPPGQGAIQVTHYSKRVSLPATTQVLTVA